ncbi:Helicase SKI2W [Hordeum vulgare]|nr:Helicase SKI2W [Hordeum vulgare]
MQPIPDFHVYPPELANQTAAGAKPNRKSKRTKAYMSAEDKLLCECWRDIGQDLRSFKVQYAALLARGGKEAVRTHDGRREGTIAGKTNSKKEDKRDAASIALLEKMEGMISKKDLREEKRGQEKEEHMNAFMKIQRRRLEMDAEKQAKMLELEETNQAKMLEIEAANAKTKAKEVALASEDGCGDHEGCSEHRVAEEETMVREDGGRNAQVRSSVICDGDHSPFFVCRQVCSHDH